MPFLLLLLFVVSLCLGDFHSITSFFFFLCSELDSFIFFSFFSRCYFRAFTAYLFFLPTYLLCSLFKRLMRLRARTFLLSVCFLLSFDFAARRIASKLVMPNALSESLETLPVVVVVLFFGFTFLLLCHTDTHTHAQTAKPGIVQFALAESTLALSLFLSLVALSLKIVDKGLEQCCP